MSSKTAIIYTRVSTDEQADKGYSLRDQEDRLRRYCERANISIVKHFQDDYSAKTFERPAFKELLRYIKSNRGLVNELLFLKWDRFSRNTTDSYLMIRELLKLNVHPDAIEQHIDFEIPEQHVLLSIYLTTPQVDNARRGLNVLYGMRRAKKEGRYVGAAPTGYSYTLVNGKSQITPNEKAPLINYAFEQLATGLYSTEQVFIMCHKKGLRLARSKFYSMLQNQLYCGYYELPALKEEAATRIKGIHTPIVSEELFQAVQNQIKRRKNNNTKTSTIKENLPLRGHLACPTCGKMLTGSGSRSQDKSVHYYYHCQRPCKVRFRATLLHEKMEEKLSEYIMPKEWLTLAGRVLEDLIKEDSDRRLNEISIAKANCSKLDARIQEADDLLFDKKLDLDSYKRALDRYRKEKDDLLQQISTLNRIESELANAIRYAISFLSNLGRYYQLGNAFHKNKLLGSIFPEKLIFDGTKYRTKKINTLFLIFNQKYSELGKKETGLELLTVPSSSPAGNRTWI